MSHPRDRRRVALQVLYQIDSGGFADDDPGLRQAISEALDETELDEGTVNDGIQLAREAWSHQEQADATLEPLSPDWPIRRQPMIDRNLLRLAWYEMNIAGTPPKVVISEAVDLAREFSTAQSPSFVNGVLDRLYQDQRTGPVNEQEPAPPETADES
ncbi:MAG: transcription antitermination factor NusB [Phycisphaerales bacterium]|nr:transcription antitermination factor NusB [Phycisphaerales bacterium]